MFSWTFSPCLSFKDGHLASTVNRGANIEVYVPIWILFLKHIYSSAIVNYIFPIESYLCTVNWYFDETPSVEHVCFETPSHIVHASPLPRPLLFSYYFLKINLLLSDWVLKSLCNFVQSDVLDILLYISVNKTWRNNCTLFFFLPVVYLKMSQSCAFDVQSGDLIMHKVETNGRK